MFPINFHIPPHHLKDTGNFTFRNQRPFSIHIFHPSHLQILRIFHILNILNILHILHILRTFITFIVFVFVIFISFIPFIPLSPLSLFALHPHLPHHFYLFHHLSFPDRSLLCFLIFLITPDSVLSPSSVSLAWTLSSRSAPALFLNEPFIHLCSMNMARYSVPNVSRQAESVK